MIPLELPGRGSRFNEPLMVDLHKQVDDLFETIRGRDNSDGFAIFGYSMGSLLAYELALKLEEHMCPPKRVFLGAMGSPIKYRHRRTYDLPEDDFIQEIDKLGGTPVELFMHREMREIFIRILRADFQLVETYSPDPCKRLTSTPLTVLYGDEDQAVVQCASAWSDLTLMGFSAFAYPGGHFFFREESSNLFNLVTAQLRADRCLAASSTQVSMSLTEGTRN